MIESLFLVMGSTGEYEDHSTWVVAAHPTKELAEEHAILAKEAGDAVIGQSPYTWVHEPTKWDLSFHADGYIRYHVQEVPFFQAGPDPKNGMFDLYVDPKRFNTKLVIHAEGSFGDKLKKALGN